jgi:rieske iron-sulfur protein
VFFSGERKGEIIKRDDLPPGEPQILAYPMDGPCDRDRAQRIAPEPSAAGSLRTDQLSEETRANAAEGCVAYSAACIHQACPVSMWKKDEGVLYCACHGSEFDANDAAEMVGGPAQ